MLPKEFIASIQDLLGDDARLFFAALERKPTTAVRLHPQKGDGLFADQASLSWSEMGKKLLERPSFTLDPLFHAGAYYVQDASSQFLEIAVRQSVDVHMPLKVLDACAAPGGKTTHLLALMAPGSMVIANEVIGSRARILQENIWKWGMPDVALTTADPRQLARAGVTMDLMVVDAPCSGEGLFRKNAKAIEEWSPAHVRHCASRQKRILGDLWDSLLPGGTLIYSTCTWNEQENEEVLAWVCTELGASSVALNIPSDWPVHQREAHGVTTYRFLPQDDAGEGFCCGVLRKAEGESHRPTKVPTIKEMQEARGSVKDCLRDPERYLGVMFDETVHALPIHMREMVGALQAAKVRILTAGVPLAEQFGSKKDLKHHPMLTHAIDFNVANFLQVPLDHDQALQYLRRGDVPMMGEGRVVVMHQDRCLGWGRLQKGRLASLFPMEYRVRK